ncbi:26733_t:CDS:2 [Racocetra persica]|uniref:26733_t:CDS:1 n=1 Tax=Racocetra persica TaxID=160502 RepID=A0ACA9L6V2_9GLOM|nr:26733_t:CDS:2 [Racocetra persica]
MVKKNIKIATLHVEILNDIEKCQETLQLLKRFKLDLKLDVINLQGIRLSQQNIEYVEESLWGYDSLWSSETAILAGNENVRFEDIEEIEYGLTTSVLYYDRTYQITNIYVPCDTDTVDFLTWIPYGIYKKDNTVNVIVGEFNINSSSLYSEAMSDFTDIVDIFGESFFQDVPKNCILVDNDYTHFCQSVEKFTSHKHIKPLVVCTLDPFKWTLYKNLLEDSEIQRKIIDKMVNVNTVFDWDLRKKDFQSIFRKQSRRRKYSTSESNPLDIKDDFACLDEKLRESLVNAGWAETDKRATSTIRNPSAPTSKKPKDILIYVRNFYQELYKNDIIDLKIANEITNGLKKVTEEQNNSLIKEFTCDEVYKLLVGNETTKLLGFTIDGKGQLEENFWEKMAENIKKTMQTIDEHEFSPDDKMRIVRITKSHLLSKIWYTAYLLPPTTSQFNRLNDLIINWIQDKLPPESNDLDFMNIKDMLDARLGMIWLKLLTSNDLWAKIERDFIEKELKKRNISVKTALHQSTEPNVWPLEWMSHFAAWKRLDGKILSTDSWPWESNKIEIANRSAKDYSVAAGIEYLWADYGTWSILYHDYAWDIVEVQTQF